MRRSLVILAVVWSVLPSLVSDDPPSANSAASSEAARLDRVGSAARIAPDGRTDDGLARDDAIGIRIEAVQEGAIAGDRRRGALDGVMPNATNPTCADLGADLGADPGKNAVTAPRRSRIG